MSSDNIIEIKSLSKCYQIYDHPSDRLKQMIFRGRKQYYKEFWALQDISLNIREGESVGIIGRNGSGKSTLLQIICGTLNPTQGDIKINGRIAALLELGAGFNPEFSGVENIYMAASLYGLTQEQITERFDAIAAFADIGEHIHQPVKTYSSGMYVRLAFAVIAHVDADILVIDEALAVGDVFFQQKCMRYLNKIKENGGTLLFVSHDTNAVMSFCERSVWLGQGKIIYQGQSKVVCEKYLEAFYATQQQQDNKIKSIKGNQENIAKERKDSDPPVFLDSRQEFIVHTNVRAEYLFNLFNKDESSFGVGDAEIINVNLCNSKNQPLLWAIGGEEVVLDILINIRKDIESPIVGFIVKNKNGLHLFGDNTCISSLMFGSVPKKQGDILSAKFRFLMPRLPAGDYVISVAIAEGDQNTHVIHHWVHDALVFQSFSTDVSSGLVGIPVDIQII